ncbi:MAG: YdcF family protein [Lachnospiraceae bacterium]|nr:YdcF family protein [Lachnospiraceae bacterium]
MNVGMMIVWVILGVISLCYGFVIRGINSGSRTYLMWFALAAVLFFFAWAAKTNLWGKLPGWCKGVFLGLVALGLVVFICGVGLIFKDYHDKGEENLEYLIVLGAQVKPDGPSVVLKYRLDAAAEYLKRNPDTICIVSGGKGDNEHISEAEGMYDYLVRVGVNPERILKEDRSVSTAQNLEFSAQFLDKETARVGIVSNDFHVYRAIGIAKKAGYQNVCGLAAGSTPLYQPNNITREAIVLFKDLLTGKMVLH